MYVIIWAHTNFAKGGVDMDYEIKLKTISNNKKELKKAPKGRLMRDIKPRRYYQAIKDPSKKSGISKKGITKDKELIYALARKRYLIAENKLLEYEIKNAKGLQESKGRVTPDAVIESLSSVYKDLPIEAFLPSYVSAYQWENEKYDKYTAFPENCTFSTAHNDMVRSKSEAIISGLLMDLKVPFRYECALQCGNKTYYPDFTIMNPRTGKIYYLEHLGLADDAEYISKSIGKIKDIVENQVAILGENLILTYEKDIENPDFLISFLKHSLDL